MVTESGDTGEGAAAGICATGVQRVEDGACLGLERNGDGIVQLRLRGACSQALPLVVQLGGTEPAAADEGGGGDAEAAFREHHHLLTPPDYERSQRIDQRQDSMGEVHSSGIPQQTELHKRNLLSLWWSGLGSFAH